MIQGFADSFCKAKTPNESVKVIVYRVPANNNINFLSITYKSEQFSQMNVSYTATQIYYSLSAQKTYLIPIPAFHIALLAHHFLSSDE